MLARSSLITPFSSPFLSASPLSSSRRGNCRDVRSSAGFATFFRRRAEESEQQPLSFKACGVFVRRVDKTFLLLKHQNRLDIPKGHQEEGETDMQTALRELQEETSLLPTDLSIDPLFRFQHSYMLPRHIARGYGALNVRKELVIFLGTLLPDPSVLERIRTTGEHPLGFAWYPWSPPHRLQSQTIDPLLAAVEAHDRTLPTLHRFHP